MPGFLTITRPILGAGKDTGGLVMLPESGCANLKDFPIPASAIGLPSSGAVVDRFIRFYLIPGFGHGFGPFSAQFESLQALQDWVEKAKAPGPLTAIDGNPNANRSCPVCRYPAWPKFIGAPGTENRAGSFTCTSSTQ